MKVLNAALAMTMAFALGACRTTAPEPAPAVAPMDVTTASRILAPVTEVRVNAGDRVRRGAVLIVLDARELRAHAARAGAARAAAREAFSAAQSDGTGAEAALALARATHDRIHTLAAKRSATPQELDEAVAALSGATARLAGSRAQAAGAAAALDAAQAATEAAQVALSYATLTAPFDGIVASRSVDPGTMATPGAELLVVEAGSGHRLDVQVDESRRAGLSVGGAVDVRLDPSTDAPAPWIRARIAEIARVDPRQHSFLVKIALPASADLRSGMFGRARLFGPSRPALVARSSSIVRRGQLSLAFSLEADTARLRVLTPGDVRGDRTEILAGLAAGDRVVVDPPPSLEDGARVRGVR